MRGYRHPSLVPPSRRVTERIQRTAELRAAGYDKNAVRRMVRAGILTRLCRGAYTDGAPDDLHARHRLLIRAALGELAPAAVASHVSAAVLHGLPTWALRLDRAHVTFARRSGGRRDDRLYVHTAPVRPDEIVVIDDKRLTTAARAVVDIARTAEFAPAVAVADAALRLDARPYRELDRVERPALPGAVTRAELDAALRRATGWPGVPDARRAVGLADGRAESVGESRSRVAIALAGLPPPELQWPAVRRIDGVLRDFTDTAARIRDRFRG
jgi:hypothetical protein